jgi:tetratricopeptide (TPR) repeat protein/predicted aspartyl protease
MRARDFGWAALLALLSGPSALAGGCKLLQVGTLPVTMQGLRPVVTVGLDGTPVPFLLDSGAFFSTISQDAVTRYALAEGPVPGDNLYVSGAGGDATHAQIATVQRFAYLGVPLHHVRFLVTDTNIWGDLAGSLGQNLLHVADVEYDLADGIVRFIKPVGCAGQPLAYWAVKTPYSAVTLRRVGAVHADLIAHAALNGRRVTVLFDTGSPRSILSLQAARRAGITPDSPGVTPLGMSGGIAGNRFEIWTAPVKVFQIGGEKVEHTHVLIANIEPSLPVGWISARHPIDMILGDDFFLSHRLYVAYSQRKLYFTYNGGPLFNLNLPQFARNSRSSGAPPARASSSTASATAAAGSPVSAAGLARRGMAFAAMHEYHRALADLTRACTLAPHSAHDRYERGIVNLEAHRYRSALADLDAAITLRPDDVQAHLARAELLHRHPALGVAGGRAEIESDLQSIARLARPAADVRLALASLYGDLGKYSAAIAQVDQWLAQHRLASDRIAGLNERCWLRATADRDLDGALDDCDEALNLSERAPTNLYRSHFGYTHSAPTSGSPTVRDSRALVYLRLGRYRRSIDDYDTALREDPRLPTSLYGRGLAELRRGEIHRGNADLAAAQKLDPRVAARFQRMGLEPAQPGGVAKNR